MPNILVDQNAFANTATRQQAAVTVLKSLHNTQQSFLQQLISAWKGTGGNAFLKASQEISRETLAGIFMIEAITRQTSASYTMTHEADQKLANELKCHAKK